jgi:hypothetical protein
MSCWIEGPSNDVESDRPAVLRCCGVEVVSSWRLGMLLVQGEQWPASHFLQDSSLPAGEILTAGRRRERRNNAENRN